MAGKSSNDRLKEIRKNLGLSQEEMAHSLSLKQGSYSDIERGKVGVSGVITKLLKLYKINPLWLIEGSGEKFIENESSFFDEISAPEDSAPRADLAYKKEIFDLLDVIDAPGDPKFKKQLISDLKGILGRFLFENLKQIQENTKLKEEVIRLNQRQDKLKSLLSQ